VDKHEVRIKSVEKFVAKFVKRLARMW